ncbi:hypothetical protein QYE76_027234 [Lolium multiflorum]|uniref:Reverse transcriptase domain-containing protein n=1 Tax=Lolium multiflorum TaxID=4521 RepID=A0AAD8PMQ2_LOLMU|nr:hypothetical protein QYE76_027234 [Lolium multiflorum]
MAEDTDTGDPTTAATTTAPTAGTTTVTTAATGTSASSVHTSDQLLVHKAALISISNDTIVRKPGFLKIAGTRVWVFDQFWRQIGPDVCLDSINGGSSRWINGMWVKIGPETRVDYVSRRNFRREPPCVRVCDVIRLGGGQGLARSMAASALSGPQPDTVHDRQLSAPIPPRINPRSRSTGAVVFVPQLLAPRSQSPTPNPLQTWSGSITGDRRSFVQVVRSPPPMDRRYGGPRRTPPRRSPPRNYFANRPRHGSEADRREEQRRWEEERRREAEWRLEDERRREEDRRAADQERLRSEERRRIEERRRLDEDRRREASRTSERLARERALADKRRLEDEARVRDRWAHRAEMLPGESSHGEDPLRSADVSMNNSSSILPSIAAAGSDRGVASLAQNQSALSLNQQQPVPSSNVPPVPNVLPEPVGSSVPLPVLGLNTSTARATDNRFAKFKGSCMNCRGEHHVDVCQTREPWDYKAPFYGSEEFGSGFYSIPVPVLENQPVEQLNYAHITVEKGEVNSRNIEHEFNVWAESMKINWRFFAKEVSPTEFRTRFPSAKAIDELAHFGKLFMETVPGAIISLEKWVGDIQPISRMEEAWFRVKGIPMNFRCNSTVYYAASLVGKPLALDKNFLRNFSYVRVKIGSQDLSLVPNTRIGEIEGGFYELQYTRELCEPIPTTGTRIMVANANEEGEGDHGTPKRQRTGRNDSDAGSQSAPPRINNTSTRNNVSTRQTAAAIYVASGRDNGKRKLFERDSQDKDDNVVTVDSSIPISLQDKNDTDAVLSEVHKSVTKAFAPSGLSPGQASSSASAPSSSYTQFLHTLVKSGSDKAFTIQKQYRKELGPILEAVNEEEASEEQVDYDSTGSDSAATSVRYINPGQGIMALAAPTLQDRMVADSSVNDSQAEVDGTQEDPLSQVDNPTAIEANTDTGDNVPLHQAGGGPQPSRMSSRIISQDLHSIKIADKAVKNAAARDVSGTNLTSHNSFALLDDDVIHARALEIGVDPRTFNLDTINYLKDLEQARHAIAGAHTDIESEIESDVDKVLLLEFDRVQGSEDEEGFTPVLSRKKRKKRRSLINSGKRRGSSAKSGDKELLDHATQFYKNLFGPAEDRGVRLNAEIWENAEKLDDRDREILSRRFTEQEVKNVVDLMEKNKAAGPDGFPIEFYQACWDIIKEDIMAVFHDLHAHKIDLASINYGVITLIPKGDDADRIQKFRPICLLQVLFKIITKTLTIRVTPVMEKLLSNHQTAFIKGRYITDGVMLLQEVLRESKFRKQQGVVLKIDFEKAYDKVNWSFLFDCCQQKGFSNSWLDWIKKVVTNGTLSVKVNDNVGPYFASCKGVRQGDPFAPFLFNMAANSLSKMISLAQQNGLIKGLADNLVEKGISLLQYADDTILLIQDDAEQAVNLKLILYIFETMSGLKINFEKSEVMMILEDENPLKDRFPEIFDICVEQDVSVADAANMNWNFTFRRWMTPDIALQIHGLHLIMSQTVLTDSQDKPHWKWTKSGKFTVKSVYNHLCSNGLHGEKDAEDLRVGADGLLKLANTQNATVGAQSRPPPAQRPLMIREPRNADADVEDDMEEEDLAYTP